MVTDPIHARQKESEKPDGRLVFGPGQGLKGEVNFDLQAGFGCVLVGTLFTTKPSAERQSIIRWYATESDYGINPPTAEIWLNDAHDLEFRICGSSVAIKAQDLSLAFGKVMTLIAVAQKAGGTGYQLELEANGILCASEAVTIDPMPNSTVTFQVCGSSAATFELTNLMITKPLGQEDRANIVEFFREELQSSKTVYDHRDFRSMSPPIYTPPKSPIVSYPKRAVIDTNVLLDASLVSDGFGARALSALRAAGVSLFIDDIAYQDAVRILRRYHHRTEIGFDRLEQLLVDCSTRHTIMSVPPGDAIHETRVKRQDLHLARSALALNAFVVTDDAPLRHQLFASNIPAAMSRELAVLTFGAAPPPAPYMLGGLSLGRRSSFIFTRCVASPAILNEGRKEATIWDGEDVGRFYYDCRRGAFVFKADWGPELVHPFKIFPGREIIIANLFDMRPSRTTLSIRAEYFDGGTAALPPGNEKVSSSQNFLGRPSVFFGQRGLTILNTRARQEGVPLGWPGNVEVMTWGPGKIDTAAWKTFRAVAGAAPNPFTSDVVGVAVSKLQLVGNFMRLSRLDDILAHLTSATLGDEPR